MKNLLLFNLNRKEKETIMRYDEIAEDYNKDWRGGHDKTQLKHLKKFIQIIGIPPKKILDVGCGTGKDCLYFASYKYDAYGIDLSQGMLKKAIENSQTKNLKINLSFGNMRKINFPDNYFDGVWTTAAIVHLSPEDKKRAIQEFYRILKPNGFLHIWVQNFFSAKRSFRLLQSYFNYLKNPNIKFGMKIKSLRERMVTGYAYLDNRHWFYPKKYFLIKTLRKAGFSILETNHLFSKRLSIYAKRYEAME